MRAMVLKKQKELLVLEDVLKPSPQEGDLLIKVNTCGVCRTDIHIYDGDLLNPKLPLILGHQIVGIIEELGKGVKGFKIGDRVGVPWLGGSCGSCEYCRDEKENLCDLAEFTGYSLNGGFAEYTLCKAPYVIPLSSKLSDQKMAPLLCAGLIGYRSYVKAAAKKRIGFYGFGAAAHILIQVALFEGKEVYAFTRKGDIEGQEYARSLGAVWAGDSDSLPPKPLDAAIIFAPLGELIPHCLKALKKGGKCVCGGIHMSDIPTFPYKDLWGEKKIESVANLTRKDAKDFFPLAFKIPIQTEVSVYPLEEANQAILDLKEGKFKGSCVLQVS